MLPTSGNTTQERYQLRVHTCACAFCTPNKQPGKTTPVMHLLLSIHMVSPLFRSQSCMKYAPKPRPSPSVPASAETSQKTDQCHSRAFVTPASH
ncbi:hypothetical protein V8C43DRAFT_269452 [Trichoderma afarasin]